MSKVTALFIVFVVVVIYILACKCGIITDDNPLSLVKNIAYKGYSTLFKSKPAPHIILDNANPVYKCDIPKRLYDINSEEGVNEEINNSDTSIAYDPSLLGAVKECEVKAHKDNLKNKSNFSTTGVVNASRIERTDDMILRETGVPYVGFPPNRSFKAFSNGPQCGARASISTTDRSINALYKSSNKSQPWVS